MSHQQVTCLTLLDLSAAFDNIDHFILLERISSSFGISSTALPWIKSYLLNRSFYVNIENSKSSVLQLFMEFLKDPSLVLYSSSYTPLLSILMKLISVIIVLYLTSHSCLNSLKKVVKLRLADHLSTNNHLNSFQSAYIKNHSTETTYLSHTSWLIYRFCYYRSFYSSWTYFIPVWHFFYRSLLDQILFAKPFFLCQYWLSVDMDLSLWPCAYVYLSSCCHKRKINQTMHDEYWSTYLRQHRSLHKRSCILNRLLHI